MLYSEVTTFAIGTAVLVRTRYSSCLGSSHCNLIRSCVKRNLRFFATSARYIYNNTISSLHSSLRQPRMYRSHSPALSQELLDYIVDFLHNNRRALRTCTLSSKCLLDASRHHLFGTVRVYGKADNDQLQRFISLLCNGSSVKWYIRKLEITSATGHIRHSIFFHLSLDTLQEVLSHIPSLRNLRLRGLRIVCPGHFSLPHTIASGPHLHHVDISNCDFEENVSISFPGLLQIVYPQTLRIYKILCPLDAPVEAVRQCPSTQHPMTSVTLHHDGIQRLEILQILNTSMPGDTLFNLVIKFKDVLDPSLMATFGSIIAKHSSSLRRLELIPGDWRGLRCTSR